MHYDRLAAHLEERRMWRRHLRENPDDVWAEYELERCTQVICEELGTY